MNRAERWRRADANDDSDAKRAIIREIGRTRCSSAVDPDVVLVCEALDDPDDNVRSASLCALAKFAANNPDLVIAVRDRIERSAYPLDYAALAGFLRSASTAAEQAVPLLLRLLESMASEPSMLGGESIWEASLEAVANIGPAARDAIPLVIGSLDAVADGRVTEAAAGALARIGLPSVRPMMDYIMREQSECYGRQKVTEALGGIPAAADEIVPFLVQQLTSRGGNQYHAVRALGLLGRAAKAAIPYLMEMEPLPYAGVARYQALWRIQGDAAAVVPKFIENLEGDEANCSVARMLGEVGPQARAAIPKLRELLYGDNLDLWTDAAVALWRIDAFEEALPVISAADWLVRIGHSFSPFDDQIVKCTNEVQSWPSHVMALRTFLGRRRLERLVATRQLKQASPCIVPALVLIVANTPYRRNTRYRDIVAKAMDVLGAFGDKAAVAALPLVSLRLRSEDHYLETLRIRTLGRVAREHDIAASNIANGMEHKDAAVRFAAAEALGRIGNGSQKVKVCLARALHDAHPRVRAEAARSLGLLPADAPPKVVAALIEALADSSRRVRASAVASLGQLEPPAVDAIPALRQLLSSGGLKGLEHVVRRAIEDISRR